MQEVDALIGQLYERINALDLPVNLVVVSDHGMTPIDESQLRSASSSLRQSGRER